jgi:outer membrane receptor protein involved in Fe transport
VSYGLRVISLFLMVAFCALTSVPVFAQMETATLSGAITDPNGRVVPDAEVTATRIETGTVATTKTNGAGIYVFTSLMPGHYHLLIHGLGFKEVVIKELELHVQDKLEQNFALEIGSVSESVTVTANSSDINTTDAAVSTVVDRNFAENLPLNGRSFQTLIQLTPGVVLTVSTAADAGQFSVNGQRPSSNYWMVDGVSANIGVNPNFPPGNGFGGTLGSFSVLGGTNSLVSVDALQEFRIQTSTYAPEFGRTPGGQISILTRSGTNQFHGTAFDYFRNDVLDANDWFADSAGLPKPEERQNDFGGTFGGPILKDRMFFFFSYEGLRLRLPQTALTTVPDVAARQSAMPALQPYLKAFPLPNGPDLGDGIAQLNASYSNRASLDAYSLRIDRRLTSSLTLFGRYNYSPSSLVSRGGAGAALSTLSPTHITTQTATAGITWVKSAAVNNDLRFNYSRTSAYSYSYLDDFGGATPLASLSFPGPFTAQNANLFYEIFPLKNGFLDVGRNVQNLQQQLNIVDNLSVQKGPHSLKFGVDFRRLSPKSVPFAYRQLALFLDIPSAESGTLLENAVESSANATLLFRNLGIFAQDTWRITPRLTVTYGLRWDVDFVPSSINGPSLPAVTGFSTNDLSHLALAPAGTAPFKTTYGNLAPRVGVAYQLSQNQDWETVVRGGFGVFYDLDSSEVGTLLGSFYPFGAFQSAIGGTFPLSPTAAAPPPITVAGLSTGTLSALDPNLKLPYTLEWNTAIEQALKRQGSISASYIGARGRRLLQSAFVIQPNANFGAADLVSNTATSDYDALQLQFQERLSHGLQALASYTWAHSIDTASAGSFANDANTFVPGINPNANRGPSDFDIRNAFSAGVTYDVPAPRTNALAKAILHGWSLQNVIQVRSAPPVNVFYSAIAVLLNANVAVRPDVVAGVPFYLNGSQFPGGKALNPAAFAPPPVDANGNPLRQGALGRNALRGFGATQWDFAIHRDFPIHDSLTLQFRAEMFNVLNHPNFGQPIGDLGSPLALNPQFGQSIQMLGQSLGGNNVGGGSFDPLYQIGGPRSIQLALKLTF